MVLTPVTILAVVMDIGVNLVVVNATGVVQMALPTDPEVLRLPSLLEADGGGDALVVLQRVGRFGFGIQVIQTEIEHSLIIIPSNPFSEEEQFAEPVRFEAGTPRCRFCRALNLDHSRSDISVFGSRDAADDFHLFDIIGGDGTHIHAGSHAVAFGIRSAHIRLHVLHIGIGIHRCAVNDKRCS